MTCQCWWCSVINCIIYISPSVIKIIASPIILHWLDVADSQGIACTASAVGNPALLQSEDGVISDHFSTHMFSHTHAVMSCCYGNQFPLQLVRSIKPASSAWRSSFRTALGQRCMPSVNAWPMHYPVQSPEGTLGRETEHYGGLSGNLLSYELGKYRHVYPVLRYLLYIWERIAKCRLITRESSSHWQVEWMVQNHCHKTSPLCGNE